MKVLKFLPIFAIGGVGYGIIEILWRGYTHWTMLIAGGLCFSLLYIIENRFHVPRWQKWIMGGAVITAVEFVSGGIINILLGWNVWSYDNMGLNLMGQICPVYSMLWTILSVPVMGLCGGLEKGVFGRGKTHM
jgi:uncharacterized membrane protein